MLDADLVSDFRFRASESGPWAFRAANSTVIAPFWAAASTAWPWLAAWNARGAEVRCASLGVGTLARGRLKKIDTLIG